MNRKAYMGPDRAGTPGWARAFVGVMFAALIAVILMAASPAGADTPQMIPATFADVAAKASPAVVNISTVKTVKGGAPTFRFQGPGGPRSQEEFREFFERFFGPQIPRNRKERSLGSGFIIDPTGLIITNNHVVEGADEIVVLLSDEKEYTAELLGRDPKTDLALIKIKGDGPFPYLELGDSSKARVGDWVVAIGNPFGLDHTVTAGILSARGRTIGAGPYDDFLQTDASINPGNSGGPLLNLNGEVIGINTAIVPGGTGIGFAIPTALAKSIVIQLKEKGRVVRGWLGVIIQKITPNMAKKFKLENDHGALVADVADDGPAQKAGITRGDVIVRFDGTDIKDYSDLPAVVANTPVGKEVAVDLMRNGKRITISVTIAELKDDTMPGGKAEARPTELGLTVKELTPELAARLGLEGEKGVVIAGIANGSPAAESGMKPGDLVVEINRQPVPDLATYSRIARDVEKGDIVLFLVRRGPNTLFFTLEAE